MKNPALRGRNHLLDSRWRLLNEGQPSLCVTLQLMDSLTADMQVVCYGLESASSKTLQELLVVFDTWRCREIPLTVALTLLAFGRPAGFWSPTEGAWIGI